MTWHLKDRLLEKQLKKIIPNLNILIKEALDKQLCENYIGIQFDRRIDADVLFDCRLWFFKWELVEIKDYDPYDWNEYPKVTPPFDKDMRVELDDGLRYCARYHKFSDGCFWVSTNGTCFPNYLNYKVVRFRPWED